ncbi:unnamed protein product [[Candida] boidinii]|nr:unnamed protein product [[Candida] boidinii]
MPEEPQVASEQPVTAESASSTSTTSTTTSTTSSIVLPLELIDKCVNSKIWILMTDNREFTGVLNGFDDFVNIILSDVTEFDNNKIVSKKSKMLINSRHITMVCLSYPLSYILYLILLTCLYFLSFHLTHIAYTWW